MQKSKLSDYYKVNHSDGLVIWYEKDSDEIVCTIALSEESGQIWVHSLYVSPTYRNRGICFSLSDYAIFNGADHLRVLKSNIRAEHTYKSYGFEVYDSNSTHTYMRIPLPEPPKEER